MIPDFVRAAVRAYTEAVDAPDKGTEYEGSTYASRWPHSILFFDTETTTDATQRLLFGSYRVARWTKDGRAECREEGLIYADDLLKRDPEGHARLQAYAARAVATVAPRCKKTVVLLSRTEFVDRILWKAYKARALIVGFNLPFDLTRLAVRCGRAQGKYYLGGFSLHLWHRLDAKTGKRAENRYRPRILYKPIDSKRAFIGFGRPAELDWVDQIPEGSTDRRPDPRYTFRGHFLDLKTLAFALTGEAYSLKRACKEFGVVHGKGEAAQHGQITDAYIDYNRQDVLATQELLDALRAEFDRHPIDLDPCKAFSPASIAKAYLRKMGLVPPAVKFAAVPKWALGAAMSACFGGRAECRIRRTVAPVVATDFRSMYPTVNTLMGLWELLTAAELVLVDARDEVRQLLDRVTREKAFEPAFWRELHFFARVRPLDDTLPLRAQYSRTGADYNIAVNRVTSERALWYAGPDLVASKVYTGRAPEVLEAFRLVPRGRQSGLMPVRLRGSVLIDPTRDDFFRGVIEERLRVQQSTDIGPEERKRLSVFLKLLANAGSFGIFGELNRRQLRVGERERVRVQGLDGAFECETPAPEDHGLFSFPPIVALITAAARLMLALLERSVTDAGGTYAFCDTDSMAVVATETGGLLACPGGPHALPDGTSAVRALSWAAVDAIVARFGALNPYDATVIPGSVLRLEDINFVAGARRQTLCLMIAMKRYVLF